jgi:hypothetical protein
VKKYRKLGVGHLLGITISASFVTEYLAKKTIRFDIIESIMLPICADFTALFMLSCGEYCGKYL